MLNAISHFISQTVASQSARFFALFLLVFAFSLTPTFQSSLTAKGKRVTSAKARVKKSRSKKRKRHVRMSFARAAVGKEQAMGMLAGSDELSSLVGSRGDDLPAIQKADLIKAQLSQTLTAEDVGEDFEEVEADDNVVVDVDNFKRLWLTSVDEMGSGEVTEAGIPKGEILASVMDWLGTPYFFGGTSRGGIDCSAFTRTVYGESAKVVLPRTAAEQISVGTPITNRVHLEFGDLVFFHTRKHCYVSHVGIYLGDNLFAHASSRYGVTVSSLESDYYSAHLIGAIRLTATDVSLLSTSTPSVRSTD